MRNSHESRSRWQLLLYLALAPEEKLSFEKAGPSGTATFEGGVAGYEARAFRGCGVVTSEPFEVSDGASELQAEPASKTPPVPLGTLRPLLAYAPPPSFWLQTRTPSRC